MKVYLTTVKSSGCALKSSVLVHGGLAAALGLSARLRLGSALGGLCLFLRLFLRRLCSRRQAVNEPVHGPNNMDVRPLVQVIFVGWVQRARKQSQMQLEVSARVGQALLRSDVIPLLHDLLLVAVVEPDRVAEPLLEHGRCIRVG